MPVFIRLDIAIRRADGGIYSPYRVFDGYFVYRRIHQQPHKFQRLFGQCISAWNTLVPVQPG
ncbi:MAG TPA: hypothetical protein VGD14_02870 [bacterium]